MISNSNTRGNQGQSIKAAIDTQTMTRHGKITKTKLS